MALEFIKELWTFLRVRKKLWLTPIIIVMLILSFVLILVLYSLYFILWNYWWWPFVFLLAIITSPIVLEIIFLGLITPYGLIITLFEWTNLTKQLLIGDVNLEFIKELWTFLRVRKKLWLIPIIIVILILGGLLIIAQGSVVAPFIYTIF